MKYIFVDTNFFIHCKNYQEINWSDISKDQDLIVLVPRPVQEEIDNLKNIGNSRKAKKARKTSSFFKEIIKCKNEEFIIKNEQSEIKFIFSPAIDNTRKRKDFLDLRKNDDRIINEILIFKEHNPDADVLLLSNDTGPFITSRRCKIDYLEIPDNWLLPHEYDSRDKMIKEFEKENRKLKDKIPKIRIQFFNENNEEIDKIEKKINIHKELNTNELNYIIDEIKSKYKLNDIITELDNIATNQKNTFDILNFKIPTQYQIEKYKEKAIPNWLNDCKKLITDFIDHLDSIEKDVHLRIILSNKGNVPAKDLIFKIECLGDIEIYPKIFRGVNKEYKLEINPPPEPPKEEKYELQGGIKQTIEQMHTFNNMNIFNSLSPFISSQNNVLKYKNVFYVRDENIKNKFLKVKEFECKEFKHKYKDEEFNLYMRITSLTESAAIKCSVFANNLPQVYTVILPMKFEYIIKNDTKEKIIETLEFK